VVLRLACPANIWTSRKLPPTSLIFRAARVIKFLRPECDEQPTIPRSAYNLWNHTADRARRQTPIALTVNDGHIGSSLLAATTLECDQRGFEVRVHWNMATAAFTLGCPVLQRDHIGNLALRIGDHPPSHGGSISIAFGFGMGRLLAAVVHGRSIPAGIMPCDPNRINRFRPVFGSHYAQL
jgi:hypothetical protein